MTLPPKVIANRLHRIFICERGILRASQSSRDLGASELYGKLMDSCNPNCLQQNAPAAHPAQSTHCACFTSARLSVHCRQTRQRPKADEIFKILDQRFSTGFYPCWVSIRSPCLLAYGQDISAIFRCYFQVNLMKSIWAGGTVRKDKVKLN